MNDKIFARYLVDVLGVREFLHRDAKADLINVKRLLVVPPQLSPEEQALLNRIALALGHDSAVATEEACGQYRAEWVISFLGNPSVQGKCISTYQLSELIGETREVTERKRELWSTLRSMGCVSSPN